MNQQSVSVCSMKTEYTAVDTFTVWNLSVSPWETRHKSLYCSDDDKTQMNNHFLSYFFFISSPDSESFC